METTRKMYQQRTEVIMPKKMFCCTMIILICTFELTDGQFVIFFPEDVHAPMIGDSTDKKIGNKS